MEDAFMTIHSSWPTLTAAFVLAVAAYAHAATAAVTYTSSSSDFVAASQDDASGKTVIFSNRDAFPDPE